MVTVEFCDNMSNFDWIDIWSRLYNINNSSANANNRTNKCWSSCWDTKNVQKLDQTGAGHKYIWINCKYNLWIFSKIGAKILSSFTSVDSKWKCLMAFSWDIQVLFINWFSSFHVYEVILPHSVIAQPHMVNPSLVGIELGAVW